MKRLFLMICLLSSFVLAGAQEYKITGEVLSKTDNQPVPGATVNVQGSEVWDITNNKGRFELVVEEGAGTLTVSCLGMVSQTIQLNGKKTFRIYLTEDVNALEEVVVVGYGEVKKSDLTGSVSSVSSSDMKGQSITSIEQGLQGRISGVLITQSDGAPDGGMSVQIRGSNSLTGGTEPLYIVDGFPISGGNSQVAGPEDALGPGDDRQNLAQAPNMLSFLNPNDIESIEVLKDASATAIYGSRAANGVVLITTKSGKSGGAKVEFNSSVDLSTPIRTLDMLTGPEYAEMKNTQYIVKEYMNSNGELFYEDLLPFVPYRGSYNELGEYLPTPEDYANGNAAWTDWGDVVLRTAVSQKYTLSVSGGNDKIKYYVGGGFDDLQGIVVNSDFNRYSVNSNLSAKVTPFITVENSFRATYSHSNRASMGVNNQGSSAGIMYQIYSQSPLQLINSVWYDMTADGQMGSDDPYTLATSLKDNNNNINIIENLKVKINLFKNLTLSISGGAYYSQKTRDLYYPLSTKRGQNQGSGKAFYGSNSSSNLVNENILNYNLEKGKHKFNAMAGFTQEYFLNQSVNGAVWGFENDLTEYYNFNSAQYYDRLHKGRNDSAMMSFLGRVNYNYADRYLFTASFRADGSSKFGLSHKWGFFPSAAFAWRVDQEKFMQNAHAVSNLKLRLSYGMTGNQAIAPYSSLLTLGPAQYPNANGGFSKGYTYMNLNNDDLRWEKTAQYNVGLDLGLFENRLNMTANFYYKETSDLLQRLETAGSLGIGAQFRNAGKIENHGFELELSAVPVKTKDFFWELSGNVSVNRNKVLSLGDMDSYPGRFIVDWAYTPFEINVGESLGNIYGYKVSGIIKNEEDLKNAAVDNDFKYIGEYDYEKDENGYKKKCLIGNTNPDFIFGLSSNFMWKNLSFSFLFTGSVGNDILNMDKRTLLNLSGERNTTQDVLDRSWYPDVLNRDGTVAIPGNLDGDYPLIWPLEKRGYKGGVNDSWVEDGSWLKLKNVSLSYLFNFDKTRWKISQIRPYVSVSNLLCFTKYSGSDPEASIFGQDPTRRGVDNGSYPLTRAWTMGVNVTF